MMNRIITKTKAFFKLVRWFHEIAVIIPFLGLFFIVDYYAKKSNIDCNLSVINVTLLCLCVQLLIAAGCVLNDIADRNIDKINKPHTHIIGNTISLKSAYTIFFSITLIIIVLSIYISITIFPEWIYISCSVYILSIAYDLYFKRSPLMGNVLMALLTSFIPLVLLLFAKDCIANLNNEKIVVLIYLYAAWPFFIIIPRELSLDISDIEGDKMCGCRTLPIVIGVKKSKLIVSLFIYLIIAISIPVAVKYRYLIPVIICCNVMLLYYIFLLRKTVSRIDYIKIGRFLWFIMLFGLVGFTVLTII